MPQKGSELSYSSGSMSKDPYSFRLLNIRPTTEGDSAFQKLSEGIVASQTVPPVFINIYPARMMPPFPCVNIETYLSLSVFTRALNYAALEGALTFVAAQPLFLADALKHVLAQPEANAIPKTLVMAVGGYTMPLSLEKYIVSLLEPFANAIFVVAYGVAEVDAGLLVSLGRDERGRHIFTPRSKEVLYEIAPDGALKIGLDADKPLFDTGDFAEDLGSSKLIISPNPARYAQETLDLLETWDNAAWRRCTGLMTKDANGNRIFQLRKGLVPADLNEMEFWDFCRLTDFCWTKKPDWA